MNFKISTDGENWKEVTCEPLFTTTIPYVYTFRGIENNRHVFYNSFGEAHLEILGAVSIELTPGKEYEFKEPLF